MIEIKNLYKRYHNHHGSDWVLKDINLAIPSNVSVGLIGRNGAGKSTLLRLIAGMDSPDKGSITRDCRVSWPIGLSGGFQGSMTGRQNVKFVARIHGYKNNINELIEKVAAFAEIGDAFDEPIRTYSSGMKSRLSFGLSLAFEFDVYLSDEATAVGDKIFKKKAKKAFRERVGESSLIIVSHSEGILRELCQAGIWVNDGQAIWFDDVGKALDAYHESIGYSEEEEKRKRRQQKRRRTVHVKSSLEGSQTEHGTPAKQGGKTNRSNLDESESDQRLRRKQGRQNRSRKLENSMKGAVEEGSIKEQRSNKRNQTPEEKK